ncbi:MAG: hypothetical protein GY838_17785 [bacterium]|nr:hypothetical protein [bacterium]
MASRFLPAETSGGVRARIVFAVNVAEIHPLRKSGRTESMNGYGLS